METQLVTAATGGHLVIHLDGREYLRHDSQWYNAKSRIGLPAVEANVRRIRNKQGLSQEALADRAGIGRSYMSGIERGVRNCSTLHLLRLARALRVQVGDLFSE